MKKLLFLTFCCLCSIISFGKNGYKIEVHFKQDVTDSFVYLAHFYAKPLPTIYTIDSARVLNKRTASITSNDSLLGGMYLVLFNKNANLSGFILNNGDHFTMNIDTVDLPNNVSFAGSEENTRYQQYEKFIDAHSKQQLELTEAYKTARTNKDTQAIRVKFFLVNKEVTDYWSGYAKKYPNTFLGHFFNASLTPAVPEGKHYLEDGVTRDSTFAFRYYKNHYWDKFDFSDNRLINAPIYEGKLYEYFNNLVFQTADSVNAEADKLLAITRSSPELFKYSLQWLLGFTQQSKAMGIDESLVYLVEHYLMKGDAYWLDSATLARYEDRAKKIAPNVLGNVAPELICQDIWTLQDKKLSAQKSTYTLLILWAIDCGHCLKEIPLMDAVYNASLKAKGVNVYSVIAKGALPDIQKKIKELHLEDWTNVIDLHNNTQFREKYDVYTTPKIYLLDENNIIVGKNFNHEDVLKIIALDERNKAKQKKHAGQ